MDFTAIDFETANGNRTSACSLGVAVVKDSKIVETRTWIIKPQPFEVNYFNSLINGFTEESLIDKPIFLDYWEEIKPYIVNRLLVAHNTSFDISVLTSTLNYYGIECPKFDFLCTYQASKKIFEGLLNYRLDTIATNLGIHFSHHDAEEDAIVAANILLYMINTKKCDCAEEFSRSINLRIGRAYPSYYTSCVYLKDNPVSYLEKQKAIPLSVRITTERTEFDEENDFYDKTVAITGALNGMSRSQAYQIIADLGGHPEDRITLSTNYLVVGIQDYRLLNGHDLSSKMRKALDYVKKGTGIQIISEEDFFTMIGGVQND